MKFIHITDTHLVPPGQTLCALDPAARLNRIIDEVNRLHSDASFLVHTGDLSYHGMEPAYRAMQEILDRLTMPYHLVIGNHDDREAFKRVFSNTPVDRNGFIQYTIDTDCGTFIMLDSVRTGEEFGELCDTRLDWLRDELDKRPNTPIYVFVHHPPFPIGIRSLDASRLQGAEELGKAFETHGGIRHLFYGHVHRTIAGSWRGIPATTLPGTNHQVALYLGERAEMIGSHEATAYGVCLIDSETVCIHYQDPMDTSARFLLSDPVSKAASSEAELVPPPRAMRSHL